MKKILLIFLLFAMVTSTYSDQTDLDKDISLARKIFQTEKEKHSCILSPKETEDAAKKLFKIGKYNHRDLVRSGSNDDKVNCRAKISCRGKRRPRLGILDFEAKQL